MISGKSRPGGVPGPTARVRMEVEDRASSVHETCSKEVGLKPKGHSYCQRSFRRFDCCLAISQPKTITSAPNRT